MVDNMTIYGLMGFTHGWARVLTVMSPAGPGAALAAIDACQDAVPMSAGPGRLTRYMEKRAGGLDRLVERHGVAVLSKQDWDTKKAELGETIYE